MVRIRTTNNRRRSRDRRRRDRLRASSTPTSFMSAKLDGFLAFGLTKRAAVSAAADARLEREGWASPHDPDGVMEAAYNYSDLTLPPFLVGVNQELGLASPYSFDPRTIDVRSGLADTLRQLKARIASVTR